MTDLFSYDDLGVLTESLGRAPDDAMLIDLLETARQVAGERYDRACASHDRDMESWRSGMETHTLRMAQWSNAVEAHAAAMRDYAVMLEGWGLEPTMYPKPAPPEGPGPAPQYGDPPAAPVAPTDADAVAMLMAEQRAAVARMKHETPAKPVSNWRQEMEDTIAWLMSSADPVVEPEPDTGQLLPPVDTLMSDYGPVGMDEEAEAALTTDDLLSATDDAVADVVAKLTRQKRKRFTELLNVELAELEQSRGGPKEDRKREARIQRLLGVFARVGEM